MNEHESRLLLSRGRVLIIVYREVRAREICLKDVVLLMPGHPQLLALVLDVWISVAWIATAILFREQLLELLIVLLLDPSQILIDVDVLEAYLILAHVAKLENGLESVIKFRARDAHVTVSHEEICIFLEKVYKYDILMGRRFQHTMAKIQKAQPGQGYHAWHYEATPAAPYRKLAAMIYLNDTFEGGKTEFLY